MLQIEKAEKLVIEEQRYLDLQIQNQSMEIDKNSS